MRPQEFPQPTTKSGLPDSFTAKPQDDVETPDGVVGEEAQKQSHIAWAKEVEQGKVLRIPPPQARERGWPSTNYVPLVADC